VKQATHTLRVRTPGPGLLEITHEVAAWVRAQGIATGLLTVFIQHTSASLTIQENADPDVIADLNDHFARLAPQDNRLYRHTMEGPDDMPAHIRTVLRGYSYRCPCSRARRRWEHGRVFMFLSIGRGRTRAA
jgi:secondary thiamine-phosphate synthase enzyme